jgi:gliding motility-associated-like protein
MRHSLKLIAIFTLIIFSSRGAFAQSGCIEIESILVNSCAPGTGAQEGLNEMLSFRVGSSSLNLNAMVVQWANTNLPYNGIIQDFNTATKTTEFNSTIQSCGYLTEPLDGVLPAGSKVLLITSYEVNTATNFFQTLSDSMFVLYANENTNAGHFLNYVPNPSPNEQTTTIYFGSPGACQDQVTYFRNQLLTASGVIGDQDGAAVNFSEDGTPTYFNNGCVAPVNNLSASFNIPSTICNPAQSLTLNNYLTGTQGGVWSGQNVNAGILNTVGLVGPVDITYTVGLGACQLTETRTVVIVSGLSAAWAPPSTFCQTGELVNLNQFILGTQGGNFTGQGVSAGNFNPSAVSGSVAVISYTVSQSGCNLSSTQQVPITSVNGSFSAPSSICATSAPIDLTPWSAGSDPGVFSGPGVSNNTLNVEGLNGQIEITYTATNGACTLISSNFINISDSPDVSWNAPEFVCAADGVVNLNTYLTGTSGGQWSGSGVSGNTFDPTGIVGNAEVTYSINQSGCSGSSTQTIPTGDLPDLIISGSSAYCEGQIPAALITTAVSNANVSWYADAAQTTLLFTGTSFTPPANVNATYYASQSFGQCVSGLSSVDVVYNQSPPAPTSATEIDYCANATIPQLTAASANTIQWYSDANLSNLLATGNTYQPAAGTTQIYVAASNQGCVGDATTVTISTIALETAAISSSALALCNGNSVTLTATTSISGLWSTGVSADQPITLSQPGTYSVSVTGECNVATDEIVINDNTPNSAFTVSTDQGEVPLIVSIETSSSSTLCDFTIDQVDVNPNNANQITFTLPGIFELTQTCDNQGCINESSRMITVLDGVFALEIPNSFTPNGDGFNDFFRPKKASGILEYRAVMFDRWGRELLEWEGSTNAWDGTFKGNPSPDGVYFYVIKGKDIQNNEFERHGSVTLIRN